MEADKALKNYKTIPTIKAKLEELEKEKGTTWAVFMAVELLKARTEMQTCVESEDVESEDILDDIDTVDTEKEHDDLDEDGDSSLYGPTMVTWITLGCVFKSLVTSWHSERSLNSDHV